MCHVKRGGLFPEEGDGRAALVSRWLELTRTVLPGLAAARGWPIRLDHCFMRVCLDAALGAPWTATVRAPAVRHMSDAQLAAAVAVAERLAAEPDALAALNRASIDGRRAARTG
ncbi:GCN5-related N-acetyltransferase [Lichenibacterium minor]|uniref:GCN5-related N-acetyltransferase n=1 Tax=Lichenibacterium minor TaxID=2316528 RepID=A0A4Q2UF69_9HYPH|nr:GCN5-related N-acetyltransferase [Lichenibacterium minor]RYC33445.1 GCN5-related N-acetyltransferase [Lichenibacterium minor]